MQRPTEPEPAATAGPTAESTAGSNAESTAQSTAPVPGEDNLDHLDWRRPHPLTILLELGRAIRSIVIAVIVVSGGVFSQAAFFETALLVAPFAAAVGRWYTTRYAIDSEAVHLHHGLLWRTKQVLPRSNIQNVSTKAGLLARMGSVVDLQISDASASGDIRLQVITQDEADRLTTLLRSSIAARSESPPNGDDQPHDSETEPAPPSGPLTAPAPGGPAVERDPMVHPPLDALLRAELTSMSTITFALMSVVAISAFTAVIWLEPYEIEIAVLPESVTLWMVVLAGFGGGLFLVALGVIQRLLALGGFRLWADPDRLRIRVGLLTEARIAARRERIQQIRVERDVLHRLRGIERVGYETADLEVEGTAGSGYLAPVAETDRWRELATEVFGEVQLAESDLQSVSPRTVRRSFVRFAFVGVLLLALIALDPLLGLIAVAWIGVGWLYSRARFRALGYALSHDQLLVRRGVLAGRLTLVRLDKVQIVRTQATYFQRRLDLATVLLSTAGRGLGGIVSIPDLASDTAEELLVALSERAGTTPIAETL